MADETKKQQVKANKKKSKKAAKKGAKSILVVSASDAERTVEGHASTEAVATTDPAGSSAQQDERTEAGVEILAVGERNKLTLGELTVHYAARDVTIALDGHTAARVMSVYAGVSSRTRTQDLIHPEVSRMRNNVWATVRLDGALAMSWNPGLSSSTPRTMTVDPPAPTPVD